MESLAPPLELISQVKLAIESGYPVRVGIIRYLNKQNDAFAYQVSRWLMCLEQGRSTVEIKTSLNIYRRSVLYICERGLKGESILQQVYELEQELIEACENELELFTKSLPYKLMLPLLCLQFPAYMLLLLGPFLAQFMRGV